MERVTWGGAWIMSHETKVCISLRKTSTTDDKSSHHPGDGESSAPHSHPNPHPNLHGHSHSHGSHVNPSTSPENARGKKRPTDFDMDKVRRTLKQLVRDWREEVRPASFVVACINIPLKSTVTKNIGKT